RRRAGGRRRSVQAAGGRSERSDRDRQRISSHQSRRKESGDDGGVEHVEGSLPRRIADRSTQSILLGLHGQGEAEDEDRRESGSAAACRFVETSRGWELVTGGWMHSVAGFQPAPAAKRSQPPAPSLFSVRT